ncbi:MAG: (E)-4-hydroxy-3-methylbut-2-enyl-diphosphate synthase [Bacteroidales bacterium]|nr:(E)-4-hydroxy-3-methylbut-2-enyl-diphosphate synthase [Bacteroidales bacterium]
MNDSISEYKYCNSLTKYSRLNTREVKIGNIPLGGNNPVRIQTMTNTDTLDTFKTVEQTIKIIKAGTDYVRYTAIGIKDANNLINIKNELKQNGFTIPIIADVHFNPNIAEIAARLIEKVRINPGNYVDRKTPTKQTGINELKKIEEQLICLIDICKKHKTALRIGTNHGSLSDRIVNKLGDTPLGMVEATMEFLKICKKENFHNVVVSLKSSNTRVMVYAYRLMINQMLKENLNYPLHLGVTEAGEGEDGRIKSAVGIGSLLIDGIGDTIRVSLTEEPEIEIPVAKKIVKHFENLYEHEYIKPIKKIGINPFIYKKRETFSVNNIGGNNLPVVFASLNGRSIIDNQIFEQIGFNYNKKEHGWNNTDTSVEYIYMKKNEIKDHFPKNVNYVIDSEEWINLPENSGNILPLFNMNDYLKTDKKSKQINFVKVNYSEYTNKLKEIFKNDNTLVLIIQANTKNKVAEARAFINELMINDIKNPVIANFTYDDHDYEFFQLKSACDFGVLFINGLIDGIWIENKNNCSLEQINITSFGILQASRVRTYKTEYISCPSCGRTNFDLQKVTAEIRKQTSHLKGLKIGIMGCIVNGPGEMADADYGYVGSGKGKITLYKGQNIIKKNIPSEKAVDELISLIKDNGDWKERAIN